MDSWLNPPLGMTTPILLAALGGLFTSLSGLLNIGLEGMILLSAFFSVYVSNLLASVFLGALAGMAASMVLSLLMVWLVLKLRANVYVVGLGVNLFSAGLTVFLQQAFLGTRGAVLFQQTPKLPELSLPLLGSFQVFDALAYGSVVLCFFWVFRTPYGFHLRAVGKDLQTAKSVGIPLHRTTFFAYLIGGAFCGLAGASLSIPLRTFVGGMSGGRGWVALVAVILSRGNPVFLMLAALLFGAASAFSNWLQVSTELSSSLLMALPFLVTLVAMIFFSREPEKE
ncbi:MAG TPA: ABC transporter permease [Thermotogota bacterium]|nr:ABC transporter permease [Thermotogota bacterium]HRW92275.1 ABC transporter permease [Thermotogota bacterium]